MGDGLPVDEVAIDEPVAGPARPEPPAPAWVTDGPGPAQPRPPDPTEAQPRRARQRVGEDDFAPDAGDVICSVCGAGNAPSRYFCRRCGATLHAGDSEPEPAQVIGPPVRRRWWWWFRRRREDVPDTPAVPPTGRRAP